MNEVIKSQNRMQEGLDRMDEKLAETNEINERQDRQLDDLLKGENGIRERLDRLNQSPYLWLPWHSVEPLRRLLDSLLSRQQMKIVIYSIHFEEATIENRPTALL